MTLFLTLIVTIFGFYVTPQAAKAFEVHGHRGARARFPENTLPAFQHAQDVGAHVLELDVAVTKDKVLVVHHNLEVNREICRLDGGPALPAPWQIYALTLEQIKRFDCGSITNPKFPKQQLAPGARIPTLEDVLMMSTKFVRFNIETKISADDPKLSPKPEEFAKLLLEVLRKHSAIDRTVVQSFDYRTLREVRKLEPRIQIAALTDNLMEDFVKTARDLKVNVISPRWTLVKAATVQKLHDIGVKVIPWTVNDRLSWLHMKALKVDGLITDDPEALIKYLKSSP